MAIYVDIDEGVAPDLGSFEPGFATGLGAATSSTFSENVSTLGYDYFKTSRANKGERLPKMEAEARVKEAGVKLAIPDDGYSREALDLMIQRKREHAVRQSIMDRTPWSWLGTPVRGSAMLLTGLTDPLNIASAFIPIVPEARVASMLARAGQSAMARGGARAAIGAAEGAVGAAMLEPAVYALHSQLQDDYTMVDSLVNMAFGGALGGGLHVSGGATADFFRGGVNPYERFAGLNVGQVRDVLRYEKDGGDAAGWTPAMRRAAGVDEPAVARTAPIEPPTTQPKTLAGQPLAEVADAPFAKLYERSSESARAEAARELLPEFRAELLSVAGNRASSQEVPALRAELQQTKAKLEQLDSEAEFKARAKAQQKQGLSRKEAESAARKSLSEERADAEATTARINQQLDTNAKASQAEQEIASLDKGEVPLRFAERVDALTSEMLGAAEIARAITGSREQPARFVLGMARPETREVAFRTALADMVSGRWPEVDAVVRMDAGIIGDKATAVDVNTAAMRQRTPEAAALGSVDSSAAANKRAAEAPKETGVEAAEAELQATLDRLTALQKNLEAGGASPERLAVITDNLASFDAAIKDADNIGKAIMQNTICGLRT